MKPAPFKYFAPVTRAEALALLAQEGPEAKILAGGQSLVPAMNFRLAQPAALIDLNGIQDLFGIQPGADGGLLIGAMTRQRTVEHSPLVAERAPLLAEAMPAIAHPQIRNRGTFGGSLAHADPAAELPALALALDARLRVQSLRGERLIPAREFFVGVFTTALEPEELLVEIEIPPLPAGSGAAFAEIARRHGDYALAGAATLVRLQDGMIADCRLVLFSVSDIPFEAQAAHKLLLGARPDAAAIAAAAEAAANEIDPPSDIHASADYRRQIASTLVRRTLSSALERARMRPAT